MPPDNPNHGAAATATSRETDRPLGRYEMRRLLGRGPQAATWLAHEPRAGRDVRIKLWHQQVDPASEAARHWLHAARAVSHLTHANLLHAREVDIDGRQPFQVFDYQPGKTVATIVHERSRLPAHEAVALLVDVLNALEVAHAAAIVHGNIKPSNVLVDLRGRALLMDIGIEAGLPGAAGQSGRSPAASALTDLSSVGLLLAEMLGGKPLLAESDPVLAHAALLQRDVALPEGHGPDADERLRAIVARLLSRDLSQRPAGAHVLREWLVEWQAGRDAAKLQNSDPQQAAGDRPEGALDVLLRRMRSDSDFPAMSHAVVRIQGMAASDTESVQAVAEEILKDVGLSNKLLRTVNSAYYARGTSIGTVSRAVTLIGFNGVRNMAFSLVLLERMQDKAHADLLIEEFLRSLMAASIAAELCPAGSDSEEVFIGALFQNLGRLLVDFYFPDEARQIRARLGAGGKGPSETAASLAVLGVSFETFGLAVARSWKLPEAILRCMHKPAGEPPSRPPGDAEERLRWVALAATTMADVLLAGDAHEQKQQLLVHERRFARVLGLPAEKIGEAVSTARRKLIDLAVAMEITVMPGSAAACLLQPPVGDADADAQKDGPVTPAGESLLASLVPRFEEPDPAPDSAGHAAEDLLRAGIRAVQQVMETPFAVSDVVRSILQTMRDALGLRRIVLCLIDRKTQELTGRVGLGDDVETLARMFRIPLDGVAPDLLQAVCLRGVDTVIADSAVPRVAASLPPWYRNSVNAPTFLLLPLAMRDKPFGLIYGDKDSAHALVVNETQLALLRSLRQLALRAMTQQR